MRRAPQRTVPDQGKIWPAKFPSDLAGQIRRPPWYAQLRPLIG